MGYSDLDPAVHERRPWNAGQNVGPKRPLKPRDIWAIRFYLDEHRRLRDRALFDLAIDSKLRGCDLVKLKIGDVVSGGDIRNRSTVIQQKTGKPVQFEIMSEARKSLTAWLERRHGNSHDFLFPSRVDYLGHLSTRQYARLVDEWVSTVGLDQREYGTHSLRRTKASHLQGNGKPASRADIARPHQHREYGALSRRRYRRRFDLVRENRNLNDYRLSDLLGEPARPCEPPAAFKHANFSGLRPLLQR